MLRKSAKEEPETISQRLGLLRREKSIPQAEMAELMSISQPVVSDYERGELRLHGELSSWRKFWLLGSKTPTA